MTEKLYYGWIIVIACNLVACITWGVTIFNQGVFAAYWIREFGWSPATLALAPTLFQLWAGVAGVFVGRSVDHWGPKPVILIGAVFICVALAAIARVAAAWQAIPAFLLMGTGFACIHTVTLGKIVARWFLAQRARAMAAATFGAGFGGAALVPLNAGLIEAYGIEAGCLALAIVTLVVLIPMALWVIKDGPESMGLEIDNGAQPAPEEAARVDNDTATWTLAGAMARPAFWALALALGFGMLAQSAYLYHQTPFLEGRLGLLGAAGVVSATTLAGIAGRVIFITLGPRLSTLKWTTLVFGLQALSFAILGFGESEAALWGGSILFGATMGLVITLQPLTVAQAFGRTSFGRIYGAIYFAIRAGAAVGPIAIGLMLVEGFGYADGWLLVALSLIVAALLLPAALRASKPSSPSQTSA